MKKVLKKINFHIHLIRTHTNGFKLAFGYFLLLSRLHHFIKIKKNDYEIHFSRNVLALNIFTDPHSRDDEEFIIKNLLKNGNTYVDVGANIGTLCLASFKSIDNLSIYAFEANPFTYRNLKRNFKLNHLNDASTYQLALGEQNQEITFSNIGSDDQNRVIKNEHSAKKIIKLQMKTLDDIMILPNISLLKIDVEGYELFVLQGALQNLKNCDAIYFEYSPINTSKYNYHAFKTVEFLKSLNFSTYIPIIQEEKVKLAEFQSKHVDSDLNLLAIRNSNEVSKRFEVISN